MPIGFLFWLLMVLWMLFGFGVVEYPSDGPYRRHVFGGFTLLTFVLFFLLGWKVFGFVVTG